MSFISSSDGVELSYEVLGEGDITLVFVGGLGVPTARKIWRNQLTLSSKYKMILFDLAGHGNSGKNRENYTMELFAQDVKSVVEKLDLSNVILVGHSMGGPVILEAERMISDRVIGLIAIDSLFPSGDSSYIGYPDHIVAEIVKPMQSDFIGTMTAMYKSMLSAKMDPQDIAEAEKTPDTIDRRSIISAFAELHRWDMHKILPNVSKPLKCIVSGKTVPGDKREEYNHLFDAVYHEGVGHLLFMEEPATFNDILEGCIRELLA
ncbi:MAG: alpha/beta hydrolase [Candidatus Thorarchaeota archaeon]|nr:alpha/beta hydrolase [Candidatus Thorarchaeota archaeon]